MVFLGVFGPALSVEAQEWKRAEIMRDIKKGDFSSVAEHIEGLANKQLAPIYPVFQKILEIQNQLGLESGQNYAPGLGTGDILRRGYITTVPIEVLKDGSRGSATIIANPMKRELGFALSITRSTSEGDTEYVFDQNVGVGRDGRFTTKGGITAYDVASPETPVALVSGSGDWSIDVLLKEGQKVLVATNNSPVNANVAAAFSGDALADSATDGMGECATLNVASCASVVIGIVVVIVVIIIVVCVVIGWFFTDWCLKTPADLGDPFNPKALFERALGEVAYV